MILVSDLEYFAPSIFYFRLSEVSNCIFDQYEPYRKMSFRNRCTLAGANGPVHLSIPLLGGRNQKTLMKEIRILNSDNWRDRHWKTITSVFNKSPWFEYYRDELERLYSSKHDWLIEWNFACFEWVADKLSINASVSLSTEYCKNYPAIEYEDWRSRLLPSSINDKYPHTPRYPQVFEERHGFIPNLSILDYLFCAGNSLQKL